MATIYKDLIGRQDLVGGPGSNEYIFVLPTVTGTRLPNSLANQVIEEVYLICDSTLGSIFIYLPSTLLFNGVWNTKIYVSWIAGVNDVYIVPYTVEGGPNDTLNGSSLTYQMGNLYECVYLHQIYDHTWMKLVCAGPSR